MNDLFTKIYSKYYNDIYRLIYSYTLNKHDSEDILQLTFIKLYKNINKFNNSNDDVKKWLIRVAINNSKNHLKNFWKRRCIIQENFETYGSLNIEDNLLEFISLLSKKYRISLYLYFYEGYSINEISKLMNVPESTVKTRLKRGKEKLKKEMENDL